MRLKVIEFFIFAIFLPHFFFGQNIDSLKNILSSNNIDNKLNACIELSNNYFYSEPDRADFYLNLGLQISISENNYKKQAIFIQQKGILANEQGNANIAKKYFQKTIQLAKQINDTSLIISGTGNLGNSYMYLSDYDKAIEMFSHVSEIAATKNNPKLKATANGAIGNLYVYMKNYKKALPYYLKSLQNFEEINNETGIAISKMNIAVVYYNTEKYDEAIENYSEANIIFLKTNNLLNSAKCRSGLARIYNFKKQYLKSIQEEEKALVTYKNLGAELDRMNTYSLISSNLHNLKQYNKSILYLDSAYYIAIKDTNYHQLSIICQKYKLSYSDLNNYKKAYYYSDLYQAYKDSVFNIESNDKFTELEIQYETKQKEQEIEILKKNEEILNKESRNRQIILFGIIILLILLIAIFYLIYNRYKLKSTKRTIETEQKLLRIQMNPHFIFNSLFAIESFMYKNDMEKSALYMSNFAKLMRMILESSRKNYISLENEIDILDYYIGFQQLRFNDKFSYKIITSENIDKENTLIPPMLVQPFIENAIEHGFKNEINNAYLEVSFILKNSFVYISVKDNGSGIKENSMNKTGHQSLAIQITKERLNVILGKKYNKNINLELLNLKDISPKQKGTKVSFKIPHIEEF